MTAFFSGPLVLIRGLIRGWAILHQSQWQPHAQKTFRKRQSFPPSRGKRRNCSHLPHGSLSRCLLASLPTSSLLLSFCQSIVHTVARTSYLKIKISWRHPTSLVFHHFLNCRTSRRGALVTSPGCIPFIQWCPLCLISTLHTPAKWTFVLPSVPPAWCMAGSFLPLTSFPHYTESLHSNTF